MKEFKTKKEALEYAKGLGKCDSMFVKIGENITYLTNTSIPIEKRFRNPVEDAIRLFLKEADKYSVKIKDTEDATSSIGAEVSELIQKKVTERTGIDILCANTSY